MVLWLVDECLHHVDVSGVCFGTTLMVGILNNVKAWQDNRAEDFCSILIECVTSFGLKNIDKCCTIIQHCIKVQTVFTCWFQQTLQYPYSVRLCAKTNVTFMWQRGLDPCRWLLGPVVWPALWLWLIFMMEKNTILHVQSHCSDFMNMICMCDMNDRQKQFSNPSIQPWYLSNQRLASIYP